MSGHIVGFTTQKNKLSDQTCGCIPCKNVGILKKIIYNENR